ncbi:MAG: GDP-6-deoxy-D-mannose reductase [Acidobacteria bacterium ADurb.Bin340]|nr:MAG: GDP-6-deoxy-D-mannose reductase [Acidobacteria bacterium ADurb.Bin340]
MVLHGATSASKVLNDGSPLEMADVIVRGTERVLDFARKTGARRFLFLSSGLAYGRQPLDCPAIAEHQMGHLDAMDPGAAYGNAKHFAEHLCLQHGIAHGFEVCIARLFAFVGPLLPLDAHFAAGNFLRDGLVGKRIQVLGDGTPLRSYLHAAELAHWLWTLMARGEAGQAYNVGSDEAVSIRELAELTGRVCGVGVDVLGTPVPGRAPARYVPDIRKAAGLGLAPRWDLETSIRRTLAWHQGREIA